MISSGLSVALEEQRRDERVRQLSRMSKAALAALYASRHSFVYLAAPLVRWNKDELVNAILADEFPDDSTRAASQRRTARSETRAAVTPSPGVAAVRSTASALVVADATPPRCPLPVAGSDTRAEPNRTEK